ncbi:hypothetical protein DL93DRAFT_2084481 [Clavulina sp. PMI_390]|nr:hypothetical protein DL93DRAFT_2084481 [Clavulina sp. PMI_390]
MSSMHRVANVLELLKVGTDALPAPHLAFLEARRPDFSIDKYCDRCEPTPEVIALRLIDSDSSSDEDFSPDEDEEEEDEEDNDTDRDMGLSSHSLAQVDDLPLSEGAIEETSNNSDGSDSDSDAYSSAGSDDDEFFSLPNVRPPAGIDFSSPILPSAIYDILEPRMKGPLGWGLENLLTTIHFSRSLVGADSEAAYRACGVNLRIIEDDPKVG